MSKISDSLIHKKEKIVDMTDDAIAHYAEEQGVAGRELSAEELEAEVRDKIIKK